MPDVRCPATLASRSAIRLRFFAAAARLSARNAFRSAFLGRVPYTDATERNDTLLVLEDGFSPMNSAAVTPDADTLALLPIRRNMARGKGTREEAGRDTVCTWVTLLTKTP